jgi:molybdate transport system regulatory protein
MNILTGHIIEVQSNQGMSLVKVEVDGLLLTSIVLDDPHTVAYLQNGTMVDVLFKETEVMISKDMNPAISIQNRIPCIVKKLIVGVLLGQVELMIGEKVIRSIITSNACKQLALKEKDSVLALIKTNEVSLSPHD